MVLACNRQTNETKLKEWNWNLIHGKLTCGGSIASHWGEIGYSINGVRITKKLTIELNLYLTLYTKTPYEIKKFNVKTGKTL